MMDFMLNILYTFIKLSKTETEIDRIIHFYRLGPHESDRIRRCSTTDSMEKPDHHISPVQCDFDHCSNRYGIVIHSD